MGSPQSSFKWQPVRKSWRCSSGKMLADLRCWKAEVCSLRSMHEQADWRVEQGSSLLEEVVVLLFHPDLQIWCWWEREVCLSYQFKGFSHPEISSYKSDQIPGQSSLVKLMYVIDHWCIHSGNSWMVNTDSSSGINTILTQFPLLVGIDLWLKSLWWFILLIWQDLKSLRRQASGYVFDGVSRLG